MLNENAKLWVAALRSGKYKQTKYRLRDEKGYCCLGVACQVFKEQTGNPVDFNRAMLPYDVMCWLGLVTLTGATSETSLVTLNDLKEKTFEEIADFIESEPEYLFIVH